MMELKWKESGVDVVNLILAAFLLLTPMMVGFASDHVAAPNAWVSGIVIGAVATAALAKLAEWEVWINFLLGVWFLVSPAEFLGSDDIAMGPLSASADRRRAGRPVAVHQTSQRPMRMRAVRPDPHPAVFARQRGRARAWHPCLAIRRHY
jgi:hypothetical protein